MVRFDDEIVLKSFYVTLMNLRTGLFKEACVCGDETASRPPQVAATRRCFAPDSAADSTTCRLVYSAHYYWPIAASTNRQHSKRY